MGPKYEHFKFAIGEIVTTRASVILRHMQIIERLYQECPGGVQLSYKVRVHWPNGEFSTEYFALNEIELAAIPPEGDAMNDRDTFAAAAHEGGGATNHTQARVDSLEAAIRALLDSVNERHPNKNPREWSCPHFMELDRLVPPPTLPASTTNITPAENHALFYAIAVLSQRVGDEEDDPDGYSTAHFVQTLNGLRLRAKVVDQ
jgi:hypothetical protein